jgi:hypothetical protein
MDWLFILDQEGVIGASVLVQERFNTPHCFARRTSGGCMTTDASDDGWATHLVIGRAQWHTWGSYYPRDGLTSSNQQETTAVLRGLLFFVPQLQSLRGSGLTIQSDNAVTVFNLQRQGAGIALLHATREIFSLLLKLDIRIVARHIPGSENVLTDALSRIEATGDYELRRDVYNHAVRTLQVSPTVDLFAASHNHKCQRFWAWKDQQARGAEGVDAFSLRSWSEQGLPYLFPPIQLLGEVLQRVTEERMQAVVVLPKWTSQPWWGLLRPLAQVVLELGNANEVLRPGPAMVHSQKKKELPPGLFLMALLAPP